MDTSQVGEIAAELMEELAEHFDEEEGSEVGVVMVLAEIENAEDETNALWVRCTDGREWVQTGFLQSATQQIRTWPEREEADE